MLAGFDVGLAIALSGVGVGLLGWYRSQTRQQYAKEREYAHILKAQEQQRQGIKDLIEELDNLGDRFTKLEALVISGLKGVQHG